MAANFGPFEPDVKAGTAGFTQVVAVGAGAATSQTIQMAEPNSAAVLVTAVGATAGTVAYVRISTEASTSITATATDTPFVFNGAAPTVRLFAAPGPGKTYNIAVIVTVTPATAGSIYFTPGQGGCV
jgi:hypothetical protein